MKILYAQGYPNGQISVEIADVSKTIDGRLKYGTRGFKGVLPTGEEGVHKFVLDHKLQVVHGPIEHRLLASIYDKDRAIVSNDIITASYSDRIFSFEFRNSYIEDVEVAESAKVLESNGIILIARRDPRRIRLGVPGDRIIPDANTLEHITNEGSFWRVKQRIPDGPEGSFEQLSYRQIPNEIYGEMFGCENVVPFRPRR